MFAFALDLGPVIDTPVSTLFSLGLCQEQAIQFLGASGLVSLPSLWTSYFGDDEDAVSELSRDFASFETDQLQLSFFHQDYSNAISSSADLDTTISEDSLAVAGPDYLTITSLAARQAFGGFEFAGTDTNPYLFMKEISSDGNVQTVDVLFPAHPILLYLNPNLINLVLKPLFENQESGHYPNKYSMHDLGSSFPNATGHPNGNDEQMPLEECGNMLIMTLAYYSRSADLDFLNDHYPILKQWTQYLIEEALYPATQLSTDDFAGSLA